MNVCNYNIIVSPVEIYLKRKFHRAFNMQYVPFISALYYLGCIVSDNFECQEAFWVYYSNAIHPCSKTKEKS